MKQPRYSKADLDGVDDTVLAVVQDLVKVMSESQRTYRLTQKQIRACVKCLSFVAEDVIAEQIEWMEGTTP